MRLHRPSILIAELAESFRMGMGALTAHKLRSALTLLGVLIGVFSIIVVMTAMRVLQNNVEMHLSQMGSQTFMVRKAPAIFFDNPDGGYEKFRRRKNITMAQVKRLEDKATLPASIGMETVFWAGELQTRYGKSAPDVAVYGETPGSFPARNWNLQDGRTLLDMDVDGARDVCVLGGKIAASLFPHSPALGEWLKIDGINYLIVGVLESSGGTVGGNQDNFVVVPITTGLNRYGRWSRSLNVLVRARDPASYDATEEEVRGVLRVIRKVPPGEDDDFEILSNDSMISQFNTFTRSVRIGVALVSSIALLAAGIGIMNIMLVSVTERTREIGIRSAIGARAKDILSQFLIEAVSLSTAGGIIGILLGLAGAFAISHFAKWTTVIAPESIVLAFAFAAAVGIFFGYYPARKASQLDPIEALRYE
jgi:putative ABC transport system permease protein